LTNAPAIFMDLINWVCKPYLNKFVIMCIDDIFIYSKPKEDHVVHLKLILELLKKDKLYAKFSKCKFWLQEVYFLGHVVNDNDIYDDPSKIEVVKNWKAPKSPLEIRSFLGLTGYYRCFIINFSKIDKPLTSLTQKNKKYEWGAEQEETFQTLKDNLCNAPILTLPDGPDDFVVYYDASNQGFGCYLCKELFSDYDCEIRYHLGKANVVVNALSRKEMVKPRRVRAMSMTIQSAVKDKILVAQNEASKVPLIGDIRTLIMDKAHASRYSIHPGADKMYHNLRDMYWWPGMKKDIATYVSKYLIAQKQRLNIKDLQVIVDRLTKSSHFLAIRKDYKMGRLARLYIDKIVARHDVLMSIISHQDG
ncbi:putative reverse transcriptase domain-containing protein, partial [Tanacetum coccineum]